MIVGQSIEAAPRTELSFSVLAAQRVLLLAFTTCLSAVSAPSLAETPAARATDALVTHAAPITPSAKLTVPYPPATIGCHHLVDGKWQEIPCATEEALRDHDVPAVADSIQSIPRAGVLNPFRGSVSPFVWGSIAIGFVSDPTQATEQTAAVGQSPAVANAFSIETNTNVFPCTKCKSGLPFGAVPGIAHSASQPGDKGWVQFVYQNFGPLWRLCVWNIDSTIVDNTHNVDVPSGVNSFSTNAVGYHAKCTADLPVIAPLTGPGALAEQAEVIGYILPMSPGALTSTLQLVAFLPWAGSQGWYNINDTDWLGLDGNWTNVNGSILGSGHGAQAQFSSGTDIQQIVHAYSCFAAVQSTTGQVTPCVPSGGPYRVLPAFFYKLNASALAKTTTAETNNLTNQPGMFDCNLFDCWLTYNSVAP
jgi:hypothetical protein